MLYFGRHSIHHRRLLCSINSAYINLCILIHIYIYEVTSCLGKQQWSGVQMSTIHLNMSPVLLLYPPDCRGEYSLEVM